MPAHSPEYDVTVTLVRRVRAESVADAMTQVGDVLRAAFGEENAGIEAASATRVIPPGLSPEDARPALRDIVIATLSRAKADMAQVGIDQIVAEAVDQIERAFPPEGKG